MNAENEILTEVEALKARFSDTKALYRQVCALLFFRFGITPTTNKLYQYVRKGTMSTPAEVLAKFWEDLRSKARIEVDHPDLPTEIKAVAAEAIAAIWRQASEAARGELAAIRVELQAEQERARHGQASAEQATAEAKAAGEQLSAELRAARSTANDLRVDLEAERRAHAGTVARLQELQAQLEQARALQQRQQEGFSADLAKAREAVEAADRRAAAADKRALMEIEQERQARAKAEKQVEALRAQLASSEARDRQAALEHAETIARLQARLEGVMAAEKEHLQARQALEQELGGVREQLLASQQEAARFRVEAQTVQGLVDRLAATTPKPKGTRKKAAA